MRNINAYAAIGLSTLAGCSQTETLDFSADLQAKQDNFVTAQLGKVGIKQKGEFTSDFSGIKIRLFSDGRINISEAAVEKSIFSVLDIDEKDLAVVKATKRGFEDANRTSIKLSAEIKRAVGSGRLKNKIFMLILSSDRDTCVESSDNSNRRESEISDDLEVTYKFIPTKKLTRDDLNCDYTAVTPVVGAIDPASGQISYPSNNVLSMIPTATYNNRMLTKPAGVKFSLNAEQTVQANIAHESVHALARLSGIKIDAVDEEKATQVIEAATIIENQKRPLSIPPVNY